jgi:HsdM N-terminal domain/N-6 DNA Methylase
MRDPHAQQRGKDSLAATNGEAVPKYRFKWSNLPSSLLHALCRDLGLVADGDDWAAALRSAYGARPTEEFVRLAWPTLLESWLRTTKDSRDWVVEELRGARGERGSLTNRDAQMAYLRNLNNSKKLRSIVWDELVFTGEPDDGTSDNADSALGRGKSSAAPAVGTPSRKPGTDPEARRERPEAVDARPMPLVRHPDVSLSDLETRLWASANALRGPVDPADFKNYVFPMLFWKWISDTWEWEHRQAVEEMGADLDEEVEADYHRFSVPDGTRWAQVTTRTDNVGSHIAKALGRIEQANARTLAGIFGDAAWGNKERLPETALVNLMNAFAGLTLDPDSVTHDLLGQAYEYLLKNFADESGKKAGEFFTPRQIVHLLVGVLDPQPGESVYDPAGHCCIKPVREGDAGRSPARGRGRPSSTDSSCPDEGPELAEASPGRPITEELAVTAASEGLMQQTSQDVGCQAAALLRCPHAAVSS